MKFSKSWLCEWLNADLNTNHLIRQFNQLGLEVESVAPAAPTFSGVLVAQVESCEPHPDSKKLSLCQVSTGAQLTQVVCGGANVRTGLKVAYATVGAQLPDLDFTLSAKEVAGYLSHGMLCGADELGLAESSTGIMELPADAPLGADLRDYLDLEDQVIEVDLTPNRADCLSLLGLAREIAAANDLRLAQPEISSLPVDTEVTCDVHLQAESACSVYQSQVIEGIHASGQTPLWMSEQLRRSGIRCIHPVVDVTNWVMIAYGQPMHAFDLDQLQGAIQVRMALEGEPLELLGGQKIQLDPSQLVIADDSGALALAGIMGGASSGVTEQTNRIVLEAAHFVPSAIAGKARIFGLHTDSSHRFERGVDPTLPGLAIAKAAALIADIYAGQPDDASVVLGPVVVATASDQALNHFQSDAILLGKDQVDQVLGIDFPEAQIQSRLRALGLDVTEQAATQAESSNPSWLVSVPSFRFDLKGSHDLIEELARSYGYDAIGSNPPQGGQVEVSAAEDGLAIAKQHLVARGFFEAITYSFVDPELQAQVCGDQESRIGLKNPISADLSQMRLSLWPGLLQAALHNVKRQAQFVRLFESGLCFQSIAGRWCQQAKLSGLMLGGPALTHHWSADRLDIDFYDLKGEVEALLSGLGVKNELEWRPCEHPALHPGQSAEVFLAGKKIGILGSLHPKVRKSLEFSGKVFLFELVLDQLDEYFEGQKTPQVQVISKFPAVRRDLAFVVDEAVPYQQLMELVRQEAGENLQSVSLFDVYRGQNIGENKKSLALGLTWQHSERTLTDDEVNNAMEAVKAKMSEVLKAVLRE